MSKSDDSIYNQYMMLNYAFLSSGSANQSRYYVENMAFPSKLMDNKMITQKHKMIINTVKYSSMPSHPSLHTSLWSLTLYCIGKFKQ